MIGAPGSTPLEPEDEPDEPDVPMAPDVPDVPDVPVPEDPDAPPVPDDPPPGSGPFVELSVEGASLAQLIVISAKTAPSHSRR